MTDRRRHPVEELRALLAAEADLATGRHLLVPRAAPRTPPAETELSRIAEEVRTCTRCRLCRTRRNPVPGEGSPTSPLMIVGEAPGRDEDRQGRPFVGRAGETLEKMLAAIGISREEVFIGNVLKCRPPENRDPAADEAAQCRPYLMGQIDALAPAYILTVGRVSTQLLLDTSRGITALRGVPRPLRLASGEVTVLPTYHPAYLLRNERAKPEVMDDLMQLHGLLRQHTGDWPPETPWTIRWKERRR